MNIYPQELKESMVAKMFMPGGPSALQLSSETGISQSALSKWKHKLSYGDALKSHKTKLSYGDKQNILLQTQGMTEDELGAFLI